MLLPPRECQNLELYPRGHPSARHSAVDWTNLKAIEQYPALYNASATEVSTFYIAVVLLCFSE